MDYYALNTLITIAFAAMPFGIMLYQYRRLDKAMRIFSFHCGISLLTEILAYYTAIAYHNNIIVYTVYSIIDTAVFCIYFNYSIPYFRKRYIGGWLAIFTFYGGIGSLIYMDKSVDMLYNYYLFYQGLIIIVMCAVAIRQQLGQSAYTLPDAMSHLMVAAIMMTFWALYFLAWWPYNYLIDQPGILQYISFEMLVILGCLMNAGISLVFIYYPNPRLKQAP